MKPQNKATVYNTDGTSYELDHRPTLSEAQQIVGGYIEFTSGRKDGKIVTIVVDEEGLMKNKAFNNQATIYRNNLYGYSGPLVGNAIVLEGWTTVGVDK